MTRPPVLLVCAVLLPALAARGTGSVADEVVAVVDHRAVLLSELTIEALLERAIAGGAGTLAEPLSSAELKRALDALVDRLVVYAQAQRLEVFPVNERDVKAAEQALAQGLGRDALDRFRRSFDVDDRTLGAILGRDLRVQRYLEGRFRLASRPREATVQAWFAAHRAELAGRSYAEAAPELRRRLAAERFAELSKAYVADVRSRAEIRILRDLARPGLSTPRSGTVSAADAGQVARERSP